MHTASATRTCQPSATAIAALSLPLHLQLLKSRLHLRRAGGARAWQEEEALKLSSEAVSTRNATDILTTDKVWANAKMR